MMRSNYAPPALEVAADFVYWGWGTHATGPGHNPVVANTVAAGFSHVSVRTAHLELEYEQDQSALAPPSLEEAIINTVRYAPPTMRTCTLGLASVLSRHRGGPQCWRLQLSDRLGQAHQATPVYKTAAQLARALQPHAAAAGLELRADRQLQQVHLSRDPAA